MSIADVPTADVEEVKHGEWKNVVVYNDTCIATCSNCRRQIVERECNATAFKLENEFCRKCVQICEVVRMACRYCIHEELCNYEDEQSGSGVSPYFPNNKCRWFKSKADFVEIIRCKDCKYYCRPYPSCHRTAHPFITTKNDYCSYGERSDT